MVVLLVLVACFFKFPISSRWHAGKSAYCFCLYSCRCRQYFRWMVTNVVCKGERVGYCSCKKNFYANLRLFPIAGNGVAICRKLWNVVCSDHNWHCSFCTPGLVCQLVYYCLRYVSKKFSSLCGGLRWNGRWFRRYGC